MTPSLEVIIGARIQDMINGLNRAEREVKGFERTVDNSTDRIEKDFDSAGRSTQRMSGMMNSAFKGVIAGVAATFSVGALVNFTKSVFNVTAGMQKLQAVLGNTLGSGAIADLKLQELQEFASQTPFGVAELTESFVKLSNQGFTPTIKQIRQLGDLASSTGKSFDQLAEAILDAQTGEYERLKEFGVRAKDAGDQVIFTFKGVSTEVEKTSSAIRGYITGLGDAEGVTGSMAVISETLTGKISNLQDSYDAMLTSIGNNTSGAFSTAIGWIDRLIKKITELNENAGIRAEFNIGGDFLERLNRALNPFAEGGATGAEKAVYAIKATEKALGEYISNLNTGADSVQDYADGIVRLTEAYNKLHVAGRIPENMRGVAAKYREAIETLSELQSQFTGRSTTPDANFGTSKGETTGKSEAEKAAERLSDALIAEQDRVYVSAREGRDKAVAETEVHYRKLLELAAGNSAAIVTIEGLQSEKLEQINAEWDEKEKANYQKKVDERLEALKRQNDAIEQANKKSLEKQLKRTEEIAKKALEIQRDYAEQMGNAIGNALEDALGNGENIFKALGSEFKRMIIRMIADAAALKAANIFQGLMNGKSGGSGGGGNGWAWLGTALNWAVKIFSSAGSGSGGGASAALSSSSFSPSFATSADSFRAESTGSNSGLNINVTGEFVQRGRDLVAVVTAAELDNKRYFGK